MRIAFIVSSFPAISETFILNQITGLLDRGHDVDIFAEYASEDKKIHSDVEKYRLMERISYLNMPRNKILRILKGLFLTFINFYKGPIIALKSLNILKYKALMNSKVRLTLINFLGKKYDIIHCHFGPNGILGTYLKNIGITGKYVVSFHGYDVNHKLIVNKNPYIALFKKADLFTANSNFTRKRLQELGCSDEKIIVLPMSLRIERFKYSVRKVQSGSIVKILTVGRLVEKKGHEYAIKSIAMVVKKHSSIEYIIAGEGPLRADLESLASELGIGNYVKFLGLVNQEEALELYQQAHIFVLPSVTARDGDKEGQALVIQEAQAVGLPVISTLHNGIPEGILDGKSGFLVPERDVKALAERIEFLIEHVVQWSQMGKAGRDFVEKKYDTSLLTGQLIDIYDKISK